MRQWTVDDVMTTEVVAVREHARYRTIVQRLAEHQVSALPVLDGEDHVIGVVSEADLLHRLEFAGDDQERHLFERRSRRQGRAKAHGDTAAALMTAPAITVQSDESLVSAARLMEAEQVKRLPVVDRRGRILGIVARSDLLKTFLRPDSSIRADVSDALRGVLQVDPGAVAVEVAAGVVTLRGTVDRRSTAMVAVRLTRAVPGVVGIVDQLAWEFDDIEVGESV